MNMATSKNKILEVYAAARVIVQRYGHTKKFAKHIVALVIKEQKKLSDEELAEFVAVNPIGRVLGYKRKPNPSTFSKVRSRSDPRIFEELYYWLVQNAMKGRQLRLIAQDSTDVPAYSRKDIHARWGVRTIPKKRQRVNEKTEYFFGYKLHLNADAEREIPLVAAIEPGNKHDSRLFSKLYEGAKKMFTFGFEAKYLADSASDSSKVKQTLRHDNVIPLIALNGRRFRKSEEPKDKDYKKRWSIERIFARLKEMFGLARNRFVGIKKVTIHVFSCLIAYLIRYVM
jgi:Transposase DDE domain.